MDEKPTFWQQVEKWFSSGDYWYIGMKTGFVLFIIYFLISIITYPFWIAKLFWDALPTIFLDHLTILSGYPFTAHGWFSNMLPLGYLFLFFVFLLIGGLIGSVIDIFKKKFSYPQAIIFALIILILGLFAFVAYSNTLTSCKFTVNEQVAAKEICYERYIEHAREPFSPAVCEELRRMNLPYGDGGNIYDEGQVDTQTIKCYTTLAALSKDSAYCELIPLYEANSRDVCYAGSNA